MERSNKVRYLQNEDVDVKEPWHWGRSGQSFLSTRKIQKKLFLFYPQRDVQTLGCQCLQKVEWFFLLKWTFSGITVPAIVYKVKSKLWGLAEVHSDRVFNLPHEELQKHLVTRSLWLMQCFYTHSDNNQKQIRQNCRRKLHESVWALWNRLLCQLLVIRWAALELLTCADIVLKC